MAMSRLLIAPNRLPDAIAPHVGPTPSQAASRRADVADARRFFSAIVESPRQFLGPLQ
jgi:hypothetical protein